MTQEEEMTGWGCVGAFLGLIFEFIMGCILGLAFIWSWQAREDNCRWTAAQEDLAVQYDWTNPSPDHCKVKVDGEWIPLDEYLR